MLVRSIILLVFTCSCFNSTLASNIDPDNNGSSYAWSENSGWINLLPMSNHDVVVDDFGLTGFAWGENTGWINFSPSLVQGVSNDGVGTLSGYAWSENAGWINFAPAQGGVWINACGEFNGKAWGENVGWISFRGDGSTPIKVTTSWVSPNDSVEPETTTDDIPAWYTITPTVLLSATDCGHGIKEIAYQIDDEPLIVNGTTDVDVQFTVDGIYTLTYYATDNAGNMEMSHSVTINIDITPPVIDLVTPSHNSKYFINQPLPSNFSVSDDLSGVALLIGTVASGDAFDVSTIGNKIFNVSAFDIAGNSNNVTIDYEVIYPGNIDLNSTGSHFAWSENAGWINFKPDRGPGVTVTDSGLIGYAWGENIGWVHLDPAQGGVTNDGVGVLSGSAWNENVGWINFAPPNGGVRIDPTTGEFTGQAWGENIGWVIFSLASSTAGGAGTGTDWTAAIKPPQADDQLVSTKEDTPVGITLNGNDPDGLLLSHTIVTGPSHGVLSGTEPNVMYTPNADYYGIDWFTFRVNNGTHDSNVAKVSITVLPINDTPVAMDNAYITDEDTSLSVATADGVLKNDYDVDNDLLEASLLTGPANGSLTLNSNGSFSYQPNLNYHGSDSFTYETVDSMGEKSMATVFITVNAVNDVVVPNVELANQNVQYSDSIQVVSISATDIDSDTLSVSTAWTKDGGASQVGLPIGLSLNVNDCVGTDPISCLHTLHGVANATAGTYVITVTFDDDELSASVNTQLMVEAKEITVTFDDRNPVASPGRDSDEFTLIAYIKETTPDLALVSAFHDDIGLVNASMTLNPISTGDSQTGSCTKGEVIGSGNDIVLPVICNFSGIAVNTYTVNMIVDGGYYTGSAEDVLVVAFNSSLGFTSSAGRFYRPGINDRINFGYITKYYKRSTNKVRGKRVFKPFRGWHRNQVPNREQYLQK